MPNFSGRAKVKQLQKDRSRHHGPALSRALSCGIVSMFFAAPLSAASEAGSGENIAIGLSSNIVSSPLGQQSAAQVIPGSVVDYSVSVTGPTLPGSPATSFMITDVVPEHLTLFVGDLDQSGAGPAAFVDNDSGLEFSFKGLKSTEDSVEFSNDGGMTFDYIPVADADGFDPNVTHIKLRPRGALLPVSDKYERFSLRYRMKVK